MEMNRMSALAGAGVIVTSKGSISFSPREPSEPLPSSSTK
jgi:hypothetical protein